MLAGMAVSAAEPSALWGAVKEALASSSTLAAAKSDTGSNEPSKPSVINAISREKGRADVRTHALAPCRAKKPGKLFNVRARELDGGRLLSSTHKAPHDAAGFKAPLQAIGKK